MSCCEVIIHGNNPIAHKLINTALAHRQTMALIQGPDGAILKGTHAGETCSRVLELENA